MATTYPHTIENGHGERLTFLGIEEQEEGTTLLLRNELDAGSGPPMHVHYQQAEALTVVEGRLGYQFPNGPEQFAGPGETVVFEAGQPHKFWAAGDQTLKCEGWVRPPHNLEYFLGEIYRSQKDNAADGRPDDFDAAYLLKRYRDEYDMLEIPGFVKAVVFPVLRLVGRVSGKFERFESGPSPI